MRPEHAPGCYGYPVYYGDEYYFYLWAGMHKPHRKVAGLVLSVLIITSSRAIWLSGYLNTKIRPGKRYQGSQLGIRLSRRGTVQQKNKKDKFIKTVESAGVPGMGPGKSYTGVLGTVRTAYGYWSQDYIGQEM